MPISTTVLSQLETLLGQAYKQIQINQGNLGATDSASRYINQAKLIIRGGCDFPKGIRRVTSFANSGNVAALSTPTYSVTVNPAYIVTDLPSNSAPVMFYMPTTTVNVGATDRTDINIASCGTNAKFGAVLFVNAYGATTTPSYSVRKGPTVITTDLNEVPVPTVYGFESPMARLYVASGGITSANIMQAKDYGAYDPCDDDDVVVDLFNALDTVDAAQAVRNRKAELASYITALDQYSRVIDGMAFRDAYPSYQFNTDFRQLHYDVNGTDIAQGVVQFNRTAPTGAVVLTPTVMGSNRFQLIYNGATTAAAMTLTAYGILPSYMQLTEAYATLTSSTRLNVVDARDFVLYDNDIYAIANTKGEWAVFASATYNKSDKGWFKPSSFIATVPMDSRSGAKMHTVQLFNVGIPTFTKNGTALTVGSAANLFVGIAAASTSATTATSFLFKTV